MATNRLIVFDTETGGLKPDTNPIMEIALIALDMDSLEEIGRWETLVQSYAGLKYDQAALDIHGISIAEANSKGLTLEEFVGTTIKFFKEFTPKGDRGGGKPILAGHNLAFDLGMLKAAFSLAEQQLSKHVLSNGAEVVVFDTLPTSKFVWPKETIHKLGECCKRAGMGDFTAHRAMPDVVASCDLIRYFRSVFQGKVSTTTTKKESDSGSKGRELIKTNRKVKFQF